jgi:non-ribosomal peptide synthetase component E (peptide arylation enzyme)
MAFQTVVKPELAERYRRSGLWTGETFFALLAARAEAHPEREALADGAGRINYGELKERIERCATFLRRIGIARGDVVTIQLPNRIAFPIAFFALELIGAVANKVNPDFRIRELEYILRFSGSRAFVCAREFKGFDYVAMAKELRARLPGLEHIVVAGGTADPAPQIWSLEEGIASSLPLAAADQVRLSPRRGLPHGVHVGHHW